MKIIDQPTGLRLRRGPGSPSSADTGLSEGVSDKGSVWRVIRRDLLSLDDIAKQMEVP
jgi:hypothetical protein